MWLHFTGMAVKRNRHSSEQHFFTARGICSVKGKGLGKNHPSTQAEDRETVWQMPESDCHSSWFHLYRQGTRPPRMANWELWTRLEMLDISLRSSYVRCTPGKKKILKYINARGKETELCPYQGLYRDRQQVVCITGLKKCGGSEWGEVTSVHLCCSNLSPESHPQHILFHWIDAAKAFQPKESNLCSENGQWMGIEGCLSQLQCLQHLCSETAGHRAGAAGHKQKD